MAPVTIVSIVLLVISMLCFLAALVDYPPGVTQRLIAAGLFLWVLTILISKG